MHLCMAFGVYERCIYGMHNKWTKFKQIVHEVVSEKVIQNKQNTWKNKTAQSVFSITKYCIMLSDSKN